ncbi:hypothetical protein FRC07_004787, partial [Ceratobasidium sp. 392]
MSTRMNNTTNTATGAAAARGRVSILRSVPMSTTRVILSAKGEGRLAIQRWMAAKSYSHNSDLVESIKMERSYAVMGSIYGSSAIGLSKLEAQAGGANILGSLADSPLYNIFSDTPLHSPKPASPVFSDLDSEAGAYVSLSMPSEMPCTPVVATTLSNDEGRVDSIMRQLDYHGVHEEDATEALRLEKLLEMQRRESSAERQLETNVRFAAVLEVPSQKTHKLTLSDVSVATGDLHPRFNSQAMALVDFSGLPLKVSRGVFIDTIAKFLDIPGRVMASQPPFTVNLEVPGQTSTQIKNKDGTGSIQFRDDVLLQKFLTKIQAESIMFEAKAIEFVCEDHNPPNSQSPKPPGPSSQHKAKQTSRATRHITVAPSHISTKASSAPVMNLHKTKYRRQPDRTRSRPNNARLEKKLQHRMSQLGQQARLKRVQFGVLRNVDFSVEYTKELLETAGYLSFEDDEKTLRVIVGGTHQVGDSLVPSIAIAIQTINRVALGNDGENDYMFLELLQHPRFERGDQFRSSTGDSKKDAKHSRTRLSQLDEEHGRIAPYASRWLKISFHEDGFVPDEDICLLAGLPLPYMDPELVFDDQRRAYSSDNIELLEDWLRAGSLPWEVAFQCEALFRNGALVPKEVLMLRSRVEQLAEKSPSQACDVLISFRMDLEGASAPQWLSKFEDEEIVSLFDHHLAESKKKAPLSQLRNGSSLSNFICHHVKITPTGVFLTGPLVEQSNRVIRRYPGFDSYFILVRFKDEGDHRSRLEFEVDTHSFSKEWIGKFLKKDGKWTPIIIRIGTDACAIGIVIGDRRYALLGYSQSGMRDHACLFSSRFVFGGSPITPASIRSSLGDFAKVIRCPARYGARMSQAFSSTDPSIIVPKPSIKPILDIKTEKGDFEFSDGCGTISRELAKKAWQGMLSQMPNTRRRRRHIDEPIPCAFQIRIGGSKGMVRMDPKLSGEQLCLRPSMTKFEAPGELTLEIARAFERPSPCFLNRPLIMLLWTNGVDSSVFEKMMTETLESTVSAMETFVGVARLLINNRLGRSYRLANTFAKLSQLKLELDQPGVRTVGLHRLMNTA